MIDLTTPAPAHLACPDCLLELQKVQQGTYLMRAVFLYFSQLREVGLLGWDISIYKALIHSPKLLHIKALTIYAIPCKRG